MEEHPDSTSQRETKRGNADTDSNVVFLRALSAAVLALFLSASILLASYLTLSPELESYRNSASSSQLTPRLITGRDMALRIGQGNTSTDQAFNLKALKNEGGEGRGLMTRTVSLTASDYPFLAHTFTNRHAGIVIYLIWKTADSPSVIHNSRLHWSGDGSATFHLGREPEWKGRITEIGLDIYGDLQGRTLRIESLRLLPASSRVLLETIWSEWMAYGGWTMKSINHLRKAPFHRIIPPTLAFAAWSGVALLILALLRRYRKSGNVISYASVVVLPWITLDMLWQSELSRQLDQTKYTFSGKTQHEKHLADADAGIYRYAQHLKNNVLPPPGGKLFILHDSVGNNYLRLKTQFYLLPHNTFNLWQLPQKDYISSGDHILILGDINGLEVDEANKRLIWGGNQLKVELVDENKAGNLYEVSH